METVYKTKKVKVRDFIFDENQKPIKLITTKSVEYFFPIPVDMNSMIFTQINKPKVTIMYDKYNNIHKIENRSLSWGNKPKYTLMVICWTKGLLYHDTIDTLYVENVRKFYEDFDVFYMMRTEGSNILVILKDILPVNIPTKY